MFLLNEALVWIKFLMDNSLKMKIKVKQIRSRIGRTKNQKRTLDALGLRKINQQVEHEDTNQILGMIKKVKHLVRIVE